MDHPVHLLGQGRKLNVIGGFYQSKEVIHSIEYVSYLQGMPMVQVVKTWRREKSLSRGTLGPVFLEQCSETKECRAVKNIAKNQSTAIEIDYKEAQRAMDFLEKVQDNKDSTIMGLPFRNS